MLHDLKTRTPRWIWPGKSLLKRKSRVACELLFNGRSQVLIFAITNLFSLPFLKRHASRRRKVAGGAALIAHQHLPESGGGSQD